MDERVKKVTLPVLVPGPASSGPKALLLEPPGNPRRLCPGRTGLANPRSLEPSGVFCENSLLSPDEWHHSTRDAIKLTKFDIVLTNPPFGSKIPIKGDHVLSQFDLGHKWRKGKSGEIEKTSLLHDDQPPQILFLERCVQFLRDGARLGIVLPESILGNPSYIYVLNWLVQLTRLRAIITMPESLFKTSGKGGTHTKVCIVFLEKGQPKAGEDFEVFMADAKWCGHDSRGNPTIRKSASGEELLLDDIPTITQRYDELIRHRKVTKEDRLGFRLPISRVTNRILVPKYYDPELTAHLASLQDTHDLLSVGQLVNDGVLEITTGVEVGKMAYGTGSIPFIRTSDISNWELKAGPKQGVSTELYDSLKGKLDVRPTDILMVRDGTYLIGTAAIVTEGDTRILFQSHIYKLRVLKPDLLDPWLLFACLNSLVVKRQIRAKQFTQDIIDTLGNRILEILLPIPRDMAKREKIAKATREIVQTRALLRNRAKQIVLDIEGTKRLDDEDQALVEAL